MEFQTIVESPHGLRCEVFACRSGTVHHGAASQIGRTTLGKAPLECDFFGGKPVVHTTLRGQSLIALDRDEVDTAGIHRVAFCHKEQALLAIEGQIITHHTSDIHVAIHILRTEGTHTCLCIVGESTRNGIAILMQFCTQGKSTTLEIERTVVGENQVMVQCAMEIRITRLNIERIVSVGQLEQVVKQVGRRLRHPVGQLTAQIDSLLQSYIIYINIRIEHHIIAVRHSIVGSTGIVEALTLPNDRRLEIQAELGAISMEIQFLHLHSEFLRKRLSMVAE